VKIIRPQTTQPIPLRDWSQGIGTILVRFVAMLVVAVTLLVLIWNR
jgi:hypothetical protein